MRPKTLRPRSYFTKTIFNSLNDKANHTCENMLGVENSFGKVTSWPQSFWSHMPACNVASNWPCTFYAPGVFV